MHYQNDIHPPFDDRWLKTGNKQSMERLVFRHRRIIQRNADLISKRKILDIASHDGRWTHAAIKCGAEHVTGVEPRELLVRQASNNLAEHGDKFEIIQADIHDQIRLFQDNEFDCVLCCGFLYHTPHHIFLLEEIARVSKLGFILDTAVNPMKGMVSAFGLEPTKGVGANYNPDKDRAWVAQPSRSLLEAVIIHCGFQWEYIELDQPTPSLPDYYKNFRVTIRATRTYNQKVKMI